MKTIYKVTILCAIALWGTVTVAHAQEEAGKELTRQMTLEREYDPSVQDANKVNTLPVIKEPEVRKVPIDYAFSVFSGTTPKELTTLPSGNIMTDMNYNKRRGYLNLAGGTYMNLNGDFGYHILSTEEDQLNVFLSHRSTNGKVKYLDDYLSESIDKKVKAKLNDNLGGINYRHQFENLAIKLGGKYGYSAFNYYGHPIPGISSAPFNSVDRDARQVNQTIQIAAGIASVENDMLNYLLDIDYTDFSQKYGFSKDQDGITENIIGAAFDLNAPLATDQKVGLEGKLNYFNYSLPSILDDEDGFENHLVATVTPYYKAEGDNWRVKLGVNAMFVTGDNSKVFASPNVTAEVEVVEKTVLYLTALGEAKANSLYELSQMNRYVSPYSSALTSRTWLDGTIGLRSGIASGFWFDIFAGYKMTDDDYFFVPPLMYMNEGFGNMSLLQPFKTKRFKAGVNLKYEYQKIFEITLKGVYNNWNVDDDSDWIGGGKPDFKAYGRPEMELNAGLTIRPTDKLSVMLDYYLGTGRYTYLANWEPEKMKNINELNLTTSYSINDTFGAYIKVNNLLSQKYEMIYGYPMQEISAMIGININF